MPRASSERWWRSFPEPALKDPIPKEHRPLVRNDDPVPVVAVTVWDEARGHGRREMEAVAAVIRTRRRRSAFPLTWQGVCLQDRQFSGWNVRGRRYQELGLIVRALRSARESASEQGLAQVLAAHDGLAEAWEVAESFIANPAQRSPVGEADHFHNHRVSPAWALGKEPVAKTRGHSYYSLTRG